MEKRLYTEEEIRTVALQAVNYNMLLLNVHKDLPTRKMFLRVKLYIEKCIAGALVKRITSIQI